MLTLHSLRAWAYVIALLSVIERGGWYLRDALVILFCLVIIVICYELLRYMLEFMTVLVQFPIVMEAHLFYIYFVLIFIYCFYFYCLFLDCIF